MSESITRSEIATLVDVHAKAVQQHERMANALQSIADEQKQIRTILSENQKIRIENLHSLKEYHQEICCTAQKTMSNEITTIKNEFLNPIKDNIVKTSIIVGKIGVMIAVVEIIYRLFLSGKISI